MSCKDPRPLNILTMNCYSQDVQPHRSGVTTSSDPERNMKRVNRCSWTLDGCFLPFKVLTKARLVLYLFLGGRSSTVPDNRIAKRLGT
jgi:hypothetical protein